MEVEVVMPVQHVDFNFDSACSTPYITAPSSPQRFGTSLICSSAPTSPTRASFFYRHFSEHEQGINGNSSRPGSEIPFGWEEKPGIPKSSVDNADGNDDGDFAFDFSGQLEKNSLSAEELFDGGKIKPLKPPPRLQFVGGGGSDEIEKVGSVPSPRSPRSAFAHGKKMFREAISSTSPREKKYSDPFTAAIEAARKESVENESQGGRGRGRVVSGSSSSSIRKGRTRSLSPLRVSDITFAPEEDNSPCATTTPKTNTVASFLNSFSFSKGYKKWKLKDFLLFRSASEGRATDLKHPLNKYAALSNKAEDVKNSSFRSTDSSGSGSVSSLRRKGPVSAHELHYTANRAVSEEMRRKTFLPYNKGLLGCLGFNPAVRELSRGFGSLSRE